MQHRLKAAAGATGAEVVAAELFDQLDIAVDDPVATLDLAFRGIGLTPLARAFESTAGRLGFSCSSP